MWDGFFGRMGQKATHFSGWLALATRQLLGRLDPVLVHVHFLGKHRKLASVIDLVTREAVPRKFLGKGLAEQMDRVDDRAQGQRRYDTGDAGGAFRSVASHAVLERRLEPVWKWWMFRVRVHGFPGERVAAVRRNLAVTCRATAVRQGNHFGSLGVVYFHRDGARDELAALVRDQQAKVIAGVWVLGRVPGGQRPGGGDRSVVDCGIHERPLVAESELHQVEREIGTRGGPGDGNLTPYGSAIRRRSNRRRRPLSECEARQRDEPNQPGDGKEGTQKHNFAHHALSPSPGESRSFRLVRQKGRHLPLNTGQRQSFGLCPFGRHPYLDSMQENDESGTQVACEEQVSLRAIALGAKITTNAKL